MIDFVFTSKLPVEFREELETLLLFHPRQATFYPDIVESVERYEGPNITEDFCVCAGESHPAFKACTRLPTVETDDNYLA